MHRIRLVIADRRPIVLLGFASLLGVQPDFEVVACCLDGASCLEAIRRLMPDVVLLEDGFTDVTASDILAAVDDEALSSRLVFFTTTVACGDLARALATGACGAISMSAQPDDLVQSLRVEKPGSDLARVGNEANGTASFGSDVLAVLTLNERTVMDLVAEGLSDSEIARVLRVSLEIVRIHIDHAGQKLGIKSRTELAALALSRRYGAMSILTAAILAAFDDSQGHAATESFTVMAANGSAEVVTIKISRKEAVSRGTPARGASKERAGAATGMSSLTGKLSAPVAEIAASQFALPGPNASRQGSSGHSIFMVAAFATLIYELDGANHAVQAFNFGDDIVASSTASDANALAAVLPGFANFDGTAVYDGTFAFEFVQSDTITTDGSELYVGHAHSENGVSGQESPIPPGSGTVDVAAAANEAAQRDPTQTGRNNGSNEGQSQSDLRASDNSSEATKREAAEDDFDHRQSQKTPHEFHQSFGAKGARNDDAGDGVNYAQSHKALHESDNGSGAAKGHAKHPATEKDSSHGQQQEHDNSFMAAKGHAKHEALGEDLNRGRTHGNLQTFEDGSAGGKQHANQSPAADTKSGKPEIPMASAANNAHSASKTEEKGGPPSDNRDQAKSIVGADLGDSFHFRSGADNKFSDMYDLQQLSHGNRKAYTDGQHAVAREGLESVEGADGIDTSGAHQYHSGHYNLHAAHDLLV